MNFSNDIFGAFHKVIIAVLLLIFVVGCGYKGPPVYTPRDVNTTTSR
ncbi:lipoprotein [Campylobacter corcagiensis]